MLSSDYLIYFELGPISGNDGCRVRDDAARLDRVKSQGVNDGRRNADAALRLRC